MNRPLTLGAICAMMTTASIVHAAPVAIYNSIDSGAGVTRTLQGRPSNTTKNRSTSDYTAPLGASFWGNEWNAANSVAGGATNFLITKMDFYLAYDKAVSFTNLDVNVRFWNNFEDNTSGSWFSDAAIGSGQPALITQTFSLTSASLGIPLFSNATADVYLVSLDFTSTGHAPVQMKDGSLNGTVVNVLGDGQLTNALTGIRTRGSGFVVGGNDIRSQDQDGTVHVNRGGHFRNFSERTDYNFQNDRNPGNGSDLLTPLTDNTNEAFGMRLYVDVPVVVPEINTFALLALGASIPLVGLIRRRKK